MISTVLATLLTVSGAVDLFDGALGWINTDKPLRMDDLKGKVVLVDFWTYCCINCLHTLPTLEKLEEKFPNELVVVGVHSAKFETEKDTASIRDAVIRYNIKHPVANDADFVIWRRVGARAWPTILLLDPVGNPVGMSSGEPEYKQLEEIITKLIEKHRADGTLDETPIVWPLAVETAPKRTLSYPGKLLLDEADGRLFVADTNNNRILLCGLDGKVQQVIGSGEAKLADGTFSEAAFNHPQGMALDEEKLYIADVENHAVRVADLAAGTVSTLAGTGEQGHARGMESGSDKRLSSPWDVVVKNNTVYVAMAGSHQLWQIHKESGNLQLFAGSGRENIKDAWRVSAELAQPSGLSLGPDALYFADSEVSAVRRAFYDGDAKVETLIGTGLFDFGDIDGPAAEARLQHCLAVAYSPKGVYIADAYNHKIRFLDLESMTVSSILGTGKAGDSLEEGSVELREPNDVKLYGNTLYIADTNNHRILKHDLESGSTAEIPIRLVETVVDAEDLEAKKITAGKATLELNIVLPTGTKLTPEAPFKVMVEGGDGVQVLDYDATTPRTQISVPVEVSQAGEVRLEFSVPYCAAEDATVCTIYLREFRLPLEIADEGESNIKLEFTAPSLESVLGSTTLSAE